MWNRLATWLFAAVLTGMVGFNCPAGTYQLITGQQITGTPIAPNDNGVIIKLTPTTFSERIHWTNFTETALKEMAQEDVQLKSYIVAYILDEPDLSEEDVRPREIRPNTVSRVSRPDPDAGLGVLFSSPLAWLFMGALYLANIFAGYQVSLYRSYNAILVCGVAAVVPVVGPIAFLCLPTSLGEEIPSEEEHFEVEEQAYAEAAAASAANVPPTAAPAAAPAAPAKRAAPTIYERGQFTFNRRFFETKLAGFLRVVPGEAERDMVVCVESARGRHVGNRIVRLMPNELFLQVTKGGASSEVVIPFAEIKVVTIRHKDA